MSTCFSQPFEWDDFHDPVDLVLGTDYDLDEAIERAEEVADKEMMSSDELIKLMQENGDIGYISDEDEEMMYNEDEDDAIDVSDMEAEDMRATIADTDEALDMLEDETIDTVVDADPQAPVYFDDDDNWDTADSEYY